MRPHKQPGNQLDIFNQFIPPEKPAKKERPENEAVADRVIREIYQKIEAAQNKAAQEEEKKKAGNLEDVRAQIAADLDKEGEEEDLSASEEYFGRWQKNSGKKIENPYGKNLT